MALIGTTTIVSNSHQKIPTAYGLFGFGEGLRDRFLRPTYPVNPRGRDFPAGAYQNLFDTDASRRNSSNQSIGHYINIQDEWIRIYNAFEKLYPIWPSKRHSAWLVQRDIFNTLSDDFDGYPDGTEVRVYDELPVDVQEQYMTETETGLVVGDTNIFRTEEQSLNFGIDGYEIEQTILNPFNPFKGMDINISTFQNTNQGLENSNQDGRIELGMFSFDDDNLASDNFPDVTTAPFIGITKTNLVNNGDCKFVEKSYYEEDDFPVIVEPEGEWRFLSLTDTYEQWEDFYQNGDSQGFIPYGGKIAYVPLSGELDSGFNYWGKVSRATINPDYAITLRQFLIPLTFGVSSPQSKINEALNEGTLDVLRNSFKLEDSENPSIRLPHIASWIITDKAYSNTRCLQFVNFRKWTRGELYKYINPDEQYVFNYLLPNGLHNQGIIDENIDDEVFLPNHIENQYRVLNQVQKIYDKFNSEPINPYSSLKIRFKMKTVCVLPPNDTISSDADKALFIENPLDESLGYAPKVEIGILQSQFEETPKTGVLGLTDELGGEIRFKAPGNFNSQRYFNGDTFVNKRESEFGGMGRFQNSIMDEWETFEFTYNLREEHNNRGLIYGVPYGGFFDDIKNNGAVEIMLNHNSTTSGLPNENTAEIYFKVPGYQNDETRIEGDQFHMISPLGREVSVEHEALGGTDYQTVVSALGDAQGSVNQTTGLQDDGKIIEAYLMYVGFQGGELPINDNLYGKPAEMVVAYWDGEQWSYDSNQGYDTDNNTFIPDSECFIIARLYRSEIEEGNGISGMDQYISNESQYSIGGVGNLFLFLQSGNNFQGQVLIDDIECFESYEFIPDVDVRKKKSVGNYGLANLTDYYDKELQPDEYKDSQAPLEAQFYFYPQYPTNETFVERLPIYEDFKKGRFYIHDINWGDGSINEFTAEPEQIGENVALYHTYETSGIFEVTGTMIRAKVDNDNNIVGVAYNKKFKLRININPGLDEDFKYFGSDGYSFIPFENTTPIIGGISKQSNYYQTIKRQLGFLEDEKISIEFKNKSDKLKTELALTKMENQNDADLEVLPSYNLSREFDGLNIYNGISSIKEELGKGIGDSDLSTIKYYNEPKSIWELFGFEEQDLSQIGKPDEPRYWKNIIPSDYNILNREGVQGQYIDIESEQEWLDNFYYPVLPKYGLDGKFIEGNFPNDKIPFPSDGTLTNELEQNENLLINLINEKIEVDVISDNSGNKNYGFFIQDFKPIFDEETLRVEKNKQRTIFKSSKVNGAF